MRGVIIRHAEVDFCWSRWCSSEITHGFYMHTLLQEMNFVMFIFKSEIIIQALQISIVKMKMFIQGLARP